jgi:hypothetical protein
MEHIFANCKNMRFNSAHITVHQIRPTAGVLMAVFCSKN